MMVLGFVLAAAAATVARAVATGGQPVGAIPWRTLAVNSLGAFALGLVVAAHPFDNPVIVTTAALGSFTTFSTVAAETAALIDARRRGRAATYVSLTIVVGVAAAWLGIALGS